MSLTEGFVLYIFLFPMLYIFLAERERGRHYGWQQQQQLVVVVVGEEEEGGGDISGYMVPS